MTILRNTRSHDDQRGFTLLEALIALVVLAGGLLAAFRFHNTTMGFTAEAKITSEATVLAEQKLEELRSFQDTASFNNNVITGADAANAFDGDGYAATFGRTWAVAGSNPKEVTVTVSWNDRSNVAQSVQLSSMIWRTDPLAIGTAFASAIAGDDPTGGWGGGGNPGTGVGTGTVDVTLTDPVVVDDPENEGYTMTTYGTYRIDFTGSIEVGPSTVGISSVTLSGGEHDTAVCLELSDGAVEYSCSIVGIPANSTWTGAITFVPTGREVVCAPEGGSSALSFTENDASDDTPLGAVVVRNNGGC